MGRSARFEILVGLISCRGGECRTHNGGPLLRAWSKQDGEPFFRRNSDPKVMEFLPKRLSRDESDLFIQRIEDHFREHAFGLYALELREDHCFIGFLGLFVPAFEAHFTP
jgi:RimJ/RimL family protein N-acetyltransferase